MVKIVWVCPHCNWVRVSDYTHHCMEMCKCGKTGIDLESYGCRFVGTPIKLAVYDKGKWTRKRK